mmetsp:Transcript_20055/g.33562  ORF Transcript_20055/g.33562 Transcript_20055/m.33562 type:complete len:273 (-) Transcript_20055:661-1479(-)
MPVIYFIAVICVNVIYADVVPKIHGLQLFQCFSRQMSKISCLGSAAILGSAISPAKASSLMDTKEQIAKSASKVPGFGQADIYYPSRWAGDWKTVKSITDTVSLSGDYDLPSCLRDVKSGDTFGYTTSYVLYKENIVRDRTVVSDLSAISPIKSISLWDPVNPNIQKLRYVNGLAVDIQVTKRSIETNPDTGLFQGFSEFFRLVETPVPVAGSPAIPKVYAGRILTRIKEVNDNELAGLERIFIYPSNTLDAARDSSKALLTIKSKLSLLRW